MKANPSFENPFAKHNAVDMSDSKVLQDWCEPYELLDPSDASFLLDEKTIFLEGGRGCGKTMLLRFLSYEVQRLDALNSGEDFIAKLIEQGVVTFYIRIDIATINSFKRLRGPKDFADNLLIHYFELVAARSYLEFLRIAKQDSSLGPSISRSLITAVGSLVGKEKSASLSAVQKHIDQEIERVDEILNNSSYSNTIQPPEKMFGIGALSSRIPEVVCERIGSLAQFRFAVALDEYENFPMLFQQSINTLIRSSGLHVGFRLGMRYNGLKTRGTVNANEFIKENNDYKMVRFLEMKFDRKYRDFLWRIAQKRLESVAFFKEAGLTDIESILGKEDALWEARTIVGGQNNKLKHFGLLSRRMPKQQIESVIPLLRCESNPLVEMMNILLVLRGEKPEIVNVAMTDFMKGRESKRGGQLSRRYRYEFVHKYKLPLLFLLARQYRREKMYYGFKVYSFISSGIPRNFVNLCKSAFAKAYFELDVGGFKKGVRIPPETQDEAAHSLAETELREILSFPKHSREIQNIIRNLGKAFGEYHRDPFLRYPENNTFYTIELNEKNQDILDTALTWSAIQKKPRYQKVAQGDVLGQIYLMNRLFAVRFSLSYRVRGGRILKVDDGSFTSLCSSKGLPSIPMTAAPKMSSEAPRQSRIDDWSRQ